MARQKSTINIFFFNLKKKIIEILDNEIDRYQLGKFDQNIGKIKFFPSEIKFHSKSTKEMSSNLEMSSFFSIILSNCNKLTIFTIWKEEREREKKIKRSSVFVIVNDNNSKINNPNAYQLICQLNMSRYQLNCFI